ncbi:MAG: hypothetical protein V1808_04020 [Candidatus Daviesbacteria bacterium]
MALFFRQKMVNIECWQCKDTWNIKNPPPSEKLAVVQPPSKYELVVANNPIVLCASCLDERLTVPCKDLTKRKALERKAKLPECVVCRSAISDSFFRLHKVEATSFSISIQYYLIVPEAVAYEFTINPQEIPLCPSCFKEAFPQAFNHLDFLDELNELKEGRKIRLEEIVIFY